MRSLRNGTNLHREHEVFGTGQRLQDFSLGVYVVRGTVEISHNVICISNKGILDVSFCCPKVLRKSGKNQLRKVETSLEEEGLLHPWFGENLICPLPVMHSPLCILVEIRRVAVKRTCRQATAGFLTCRHKFSLFRIWARYFFT